MKYDLLPIGSIVKLKNDERLLMIYGVLQKTVTEPEKVFDYAGVSYPEGNFMPGSHKLFNTEDIAEIRFRGYEDDEGIRESFIAYLCFIDYIKEKEKESAENADKSNIFK